MGTIYKDNTDLLTVAETKRLIVGSMPTEMAVSVFASLNEKGEVEGSLEVGKPSDTCIQADFIDTDFPALCHQQGITPRHKYRPVFMDYSGAVERDAYYTITHVEFVRLAELFGLLVVVGKAPEPLPSSVVRNTTKETRRDSLTPVIEMAQTTCRNANDTAEVWAALQVLAEQKQAPLIGATEDGLQYLKSGNAAIFTRESLRKRLAREAPLSTANRR